MEPQNNEMNELDSIFKNLENQTPDDLINIGKDSEVKDPTDTKETVEKQEVPVQDEQNNKTPEEQDSKENDKMISFDISLKEPVITEKEEQEEKKEILSKVKNLNVANKAFNIIANAKKNAGKNISNAISRKRIYIAGIALLTLPTVKLVTDAYIAYKDNQSTPPAYIEEITVASKESQQKMSNSPLKVQEAYVNYVFKNLPDMEYYSFLGGAFNELENNIQITRANYEYTKEEADIDSFASKSLAKAESVYRESLAKVDDECWTIGVPSLGFSNTVFSDAITQEDQVYLNYNTLVQKKIINSSDYSDGRVPTGSIVSPDGQIYVPISVLTEEHSTNKSI